MKKLSVKFALLACIILFSCGLLAINGAAAPHDGTPGVSVPEESLSRETRRELARARRATAKYHDISEAISDGYADINVFMPQMGFHYLRSANLDANFDPEQPELLVYAPDLCENRMRLVAVEYAVPLNLSPNAPPEGFTGNADMWHRNEQFGLWTLHAWIWYKNPDGIFSAYNPRVP